MVAMRPFYFYFSVNLLSRDLDIRVLAGCTFVSVVKDQYLTLGTHIHAENNKPVIIWACRQSY